MYPFASLPENLAAFCGILRRTHGFRVGPGELQDAASALEVVELSDERAVRHALRPILTSARAELPVFDRAFTEFFFPRDDGRLSEQMTPTRLDVGSNTAKSHGPGVSPDNPETRAPAVDDEAEGFDAGDSAAAQFQTTDDESDHATAFARASYSPIEAFGAETPDLMRVETEWRDAARVAGAAAARRTLARLEAGPSRATLRSATHAAGQPADWRRGACAALAATSHDAATNRVDHRR